MRLPTPRRRLGLLALLPAIARAQPSGAPPEPALSWAGNWEVVREDPRTRGAALPLLRLRISQEPGSDTPELRWMAGIATGIARDVVADERQLSCLLDVPPGESGPFRLVLTRGAEEQAWVMGRGFPGRGEISYAVAARRLPE